MTDAKIQIKLGQIDFSGEGQQEWVAKQLDKVIEKAKDLIALAPTLKQLEGNDEFKHKVKDSAIAQKNSTGLSRRKGGDKKPSQEVLGYSNMVGS